MINDIAVISTIVFFAAFCHAHASLHSILATCISVREFHLKPLCYIPHFLHSQVKTGVFTHQADILSRLRAQLTDNLIARQATCARSELHSRGDNLISQPATALAIINMSQSALFMDSVDTVWQTLWRRLSARCWRTHTAAQTHINAKTRGGGDCWMRSRECITQEPRRSRDQ